MAEKKDDADNKKLDKLENDFQEFKAEWNKFLTNHMVHLSANVETLVQQCGELQKQNSEMKKSMSKMEKNIIKALGAQAHNWAEKK